MRTLREIFRANQYAVASRFSETNGNADNRENFYWLAAYADPIDSADFSDFFERFARNYLNERSQLVREAMLGMYLSQINPNSAPTDGKSVKLGRRKRDLKPVHYDMLGGLLVDCWRTTPLTADALDAIEFPLMDAVLDTIRTNSNDHARELYRLMTNRIARVMEIASGDYVFDLHHSAIQLAQQDPSIICSEYLLLNIAVLKLGKKFLSPNMQRETDRINNSRKHGNDDVFLPPHFTRAEEAIEEYNNALSIAYDKAALALYEALPKSKLTEKENEIRRSAFVAVPEDRFWGLSHSAELRRSQSDPVWQLRAVEKCVERFQPKPAPRVPALPAPSPHYSPSQWPG